MSGIRAKAGACRGVAGFSLVEVMVALMVIAVGFTALLASVAVGLRTAQKTNAELTGYVAARSFVDRVEAHFSIPLDSMAFEDISTLKTGDNDPYNTYYVPGKMTAIVGYYTSSAFKEAMEATMPHPEHPDHPKDSLKNIFLGKNASYLSGQLDDLDHLANLGTIYYKENEGNSYSSSSLDNNAPLSVNALPTRWVDGNHKASVPSGEAEPNYFSIGPYRLMADFENLYEDLEDFDKDYAVVSFMPYRVTVYVFGMDFPRDTITAHYYASRNSDGVSVFSDVEKQAGEQVANRRKEALGIYTFTARLGKAVAPFR